MVLAREQVAVDMRVVSAQDVQPAKEDQRIVDRYASHVMRQLGRGRRMGAEERICDTSRSDEEKCRGCDNEEGTEKHRLYQWPSWKEVRNQIPEGLWKWEQVRRLKGGVRPLGSGLVAFFTSIAARFLVTFLIKETIF